MRGLLRRISSSSSSSCQNFGVPRLRSDLSYLPVQAARCGLFGFISQLEPPSNDRVAYLRAIVRAGLLSGHFEVLVAWLADRGFSEGNDLLWELLALHNLWDTLDTLGYFKRLDAGQQERCLTFWLRHYPPHLESTLPMAFLDASSSLLTRDSLYNFWRLALQAYPRHAEMFLVLLANTTGDSRLHESDGVLYQGHDDECFAALPEACLLRLLKLLTYLPAALVLEFVRRRMVSTMRLLPEYVSYSLWPEQGEVFEARLSEILGSVESGNAGAGDSIAWRLTEEAIQEWIYS